MSHIDRLGSLEDTQGEVTAIASDPSGRVLYSGGHDHVIRLWDLRRMQCIRFIEDRNTSLGMHRGAITSLVAPTENLLISASTDGFLRCFHVSAIEDTKESTISLDSILRGEFDISADLFDSPAGNDRLIQCFSPAGNESISRFCVGDGVVALTTNQGDFQIREFHRDDSQLISTEKWKLRLRRHFGAIADLAYSPRGECTSAGSDYRVLLSEEGRILGEGSISFAPRDIAYVGGWLLVGGRDRDVHVFPREWFDGSAGMHSCRLVGHAGNVAAMAVMKNRGIVVTGGEDVGVFLGYFCRVCCVVT